MVDESFYIEHIEFFTVDSLTTVYFVLYLLNIFYFIGKFFKINNTTFT